METNWLSPAYSSEEALPWRTPSCQFLPEWDVQFCTVIWAFSTDVSLGLFWGKCYFLQLEQSLAQWKRQNRDQNTTTASSYRFLNPTGFSNWFCSSSKAKPGKHAGMSSLLLHWPSLGSHPSKGKKNRRTAERELCGSFAIGWNCHCNEQHQMVPTYGFPALSPTSEQTVTTQGTTNWFVARKPGKNMQQVVEPTLAA